MNQQLTRLSLTCLLAGCGLLTVQPIAAQSPTSVDFNGQIRPLLQNRCFACHGPDEEARESDLRLDDREISLSELSSGLRAIVPGKSDKSELIARITTTDDDLRMPPPDAGAALTPDEVDLVRRWIDAGAGFQRHWSFQSPEAQALPTPLSEPSWVRDGTDAFALARLDAENMAPAGQADRYTLIRRLSLDLTGLPPAIAEVDRFVGDPAPDAYEQLVDRLLQSPAFGERWGRVWLDLARYADSAGYAQDPARVIWRYRDWVIDALNSNMPFDQFTVEQLAGDLLENPTSDQLLATAFHRNTMTNSEGGTDDEEFRSAAVVDRVNTTMQVWMGMTMGCAQCHTHKYDPITQKEYFQFYAVFNCTADADRGDDEPALQEFSASERRARKRLTAEIEALTKQLGEEASDARASVEPPDGPVAGRYVRIELTGQQVFLSLAEVQVFSGTANVALTGAATQSSEAYRGPARLAIDNNTDGQYAASSTTHTAAEDNPWWEVKLDRTVNMDRIVIWNRTDGDLEQRLRNFRLVVLDDQRRPRWVQTFGAPPEPSVATDLPVSPEEFSQQDRQALVAYLSQHQPALNRTRERIETLKKQLAQIAGTKTPVMRELTGDGRRETHVHIRGNFLSKGEQVSAGVPAAFHALPAGAAANRLTVAGWLVGADNPLSARVTVNRFWEHLFGTGIVETSEDFGRQGEPPSNSALLDHLAIELVRHDWDVKWLLRKIVTSSTYRQASVATPDKLQRDPRNRLLSRGPNFRIPAEMIRDQALSIAGLLCRNMHGPSVRPPRPVLGLRSAFGGSTDWQTSTGADRFRRGLYTRWRRTTPYPSLTTFDAPSREVCTIRRVRTNTPLQALVTLNDPVFVEAAQGFARRISREGGNSTESRLIFAFRSCVARFPSDAELMRLLELYEQVLQRYRNDPKAAGQMALEPLGPHHLAVGNDELATWTVIANVLLNLDELLAKI